MHVVFLLTALCIASHALASSTPGLRKSGDLGVTHCQLQSKLGEEQALVHVWIRAFVGPAAHTQRARKKAARQRSRASPHSSEWQLHVKGFLFVESAKTVPDKWGAMRNPVSRQTQVFLRLYNSSRQYGLQARREGDVDMLALWGNFTMEGADASHGTWEFEVNVVGLQHVCYILASPLPSKGKAPPTGSSTGSNSPAGHVQLPLGQPGQTVWLMSPFYGMPPEVFASLLYWHVLWHRKFGVGLHVVYIISGLAAILKTAQIQELLVQGSLQLVLWQDMAELPHLMHAHQIIMYNHGMLALHDPRLLVVITDLDEYLITPRPMSVSQILSECPTGAGNFAKRALSSLRITRWNAYSQTPSQSGELWLWLNNSNNSNNSTTAASVAHQSLSMHEERRQLPSLLGDPAKESSIAFPGGKLAASQSYKRQGVAVAPVLAVATDDVAVAAGQGVRRPLRVAVLPSRQLSTSSSASPSSASASSSSSSLSSEQLVGSKAQSMAPLQELEALTASGLLSGWEAQLQVHPLNNYFVDFFGREELRVKSVYRPWTTMTVRVHKGDPLPKARYLDAKLKCVRFLHLRNLFKTRDGTPNATLVVPDTWTDWQWPMHA